MKRLFKRFEDVMTAVTFAEAGYFQFAKEVLRDDRAALARIEAVKQGVDLTIEDIKSMAITFAEAGEFEMAVRLMKEAEESVGRVKKDYQKVFEQRVPALNN